MTGLAIAAAVLVGSTTFALIVARFMRVGSERVMPTPPLPARLDPRAGQHATQAAHATFTALLVAVAVVGLGLAQQITGGPA